MLKTDYKDDILNTDVNVNRKFSIVRSNGTVVEQNVELRETTTFKQTGDSFGAKDINETNEAVNDVRGQICTNLLNPTAQTQTINGVTFTSNGDGTYTVNGTASNIIYYQLAIANQFPNFVLSRKYKIVGCPQGGSRDTYILYDNQYYDANSVDVGNGAVYTAKNKPSIYIRIMEGTTVNNLIFKPMLTTDLSATYDDYVPYTGNSGRLNENVANLFDIIRPVGSLYSTTDVNFDPNTAKGWHGTWERIKDCVIYAAGDSDTVGSIVGSNTHTLTEAEMPSHRHSIPSLSGTATGGKHKHRTERNVWTQRSGYGSVNPSESGGANMANVTATGEIIAESSDLSMSVTTNASNTDYTGSGTAIDIRPRRLNSVVWRRTA